MATRQTALLAIAVSTGCAADLADIHYEDLGGKSDDFSYYTATFDGRQLDEESARRILAGTRVVAQADGTSTLEAPVILLHAEDVQCLDVRLAEAVHKSQGGSAALRRRISAVAPHGVTGEDCDLVELILNDSLDDVEVQRLILMHGDIAEADHALEQLRATAV